MEHSHFKLYKPVGMLSQLSTGEERQRRTKRFLGELFDFPPGSMPIGRLDEKSEGLLLMTTDGKLSDTINNSGMEKEYWVQLDGVITADALQQLSKSISIGIFGEKYSTKPSLATPLATAPALPEAHASLRIGRHRPTSWISMTITEGKFRQLRKMTAAVGFPTLRLVRVRIGSIHLSTLQPREVYAIKPDELII